jgi:anti-sigma factor RsiW
MSEFLSRARFARDHRWAPGRMSAYLDGELAPSHRVRMERHVSECVECRRLLAGLHQVVGWLHRLPAPGGGADALQVAAAVRLRLKEPPAS